MAQPWTSWSSIASRLGRPVASGSGTAGGLPIDCDRESNGTSAGRLLNFCTRLRTTGGNGPYWTFLFMNSDPKITTVQMMA
jgi:hypothetical protein